MKLNVLLFFSVAASVGLFCLVTRRKREEERESKRNKFQVIKLRVTGDVLGEYAGEIAKVQPRIVKVQGEIKALESELTDEQAKETGMKSEADGCESSKVSQSLRQPI